MSSQLRASPVPDTRRWGALGLLSAAQFLVILDTSIIGVALPAIKDALRFSTVGQQWVFNAYAIAFGGLLLVGDRLADLLGPRRIFAAGFAVLAGSSLLAGLAWTSGVLVAAYRLSVQAGNPLSERRLAQMFGRTSRRWARQNRRGTTSVGAPRLTGHPGHGLSVSRGPPSLRNAI